MYGKVARYFLTNLVLSTKKLFHEQAIASVHIQNLWDIKWSDLGLRKAVGFFYSSILEQPQQTGLVKIGIKL
jgi:hypothetical protein